MIKATILSDRTVLKISGPDARSFLQGLISNNIDKLDTSHALYAALLTPQGKIITDFVLAEVEGGIFLDCAKQTSADLVARFKRYKLRSKVVIEEANEDYTVIASNDPAPAGLSLLACMADPRLSSMGYRWIAKSEKLEEHLSENSIEQEPREHYECHRIECGIPDSVRDLTPEALFPLDCNFEELHGVDFNKGCYVGQELTSRMKHRASSRRRILPVTAESPLPPPGTKITLNGTDIGEMLGTLGSIGLAQIRLDRLGDVLQAMAETMKIQVGRPPYQLTSNAEPA